MARAAVLDLLRGDAQLATLGGAGFAIEPNYSYDQRPNDKGPFVVLIWRQTDFSREIQNNSARHLNVWVHIPSAVSTDYVRIDNILDRIDELFDGVDGTDIVGADGWSLNYIQRHGRSPDLKDEDYQTICRYASYSAFSHKTA